MVADFGNHSLLDTPESSAKEQNRRVTTARRCLITPTRLMEGDSRARAGGHHFLWAFCLV